MIKEILIPTILPWLVPFLLGIIAAKWVKPWVHSDEKRLAKAQEISVIASRITRQLVLRFPNHTWDNILESVVTELIAELDLNPGTARREAIYQLDNLMLTKRLYESKFIPAKDLCGVDCG